MTTKFKTKLSDGSRGENVDIDNDGVTYINRGWDDSVSIVLMPCEIKQIYDKLVDLGHL